MASSLSPECTPLKLKYDACFNSWFEGYLEPITPSGAPLSAAAVQQRNKDKAEEYERKCGQVWKNYRECVQKAVTNKSLDRLLEEAREDNPLKDPPPPSREERENKS